jgi:hypothetical protein
LSPKSPKQARREDCQHALLAHQVFASPFMSFTGFSLGMNLFHFEVFTLSAGIKVPNNQSSHIWDRWKGIGP